MKEETLLQENKEFERFFEINLNLLSIADVYGNFIKVNKAWSKLLGYSTDELENMKFLDLIHPDDLEITLKAVEKLKEQKTVINFINRFKDKNGNYHYIEWNSKPYGEKIYASARDITKEYREKEKLRLSEEKFRSYFESSPTGIFITNGKGNYIDINQSACRLLGYKKDELIGKNILDIADTSEKNEHLAKFNELKNTGTLRVEIKLLSKNNEIKFVRLNAIKLRDDKYLGFVEDLSEINEEHNKNTKILETAIDGFFMTNEKGNIIDINPAFEAMLGYKKTEIIGKKITHFEDSESENEIKKHAEYIKSKGSDRFETVYKNKYGEKIDIEASVTHLKLSGDKDLFFAFVRDITDRKIEQKEIKKIKERFELAVEGGNIGIWDWNIQTGEIYYNKNWANMLGYREGEIEYNVKSWEELIHPEDLKNVNKMLEDFLAGNKKIYRTEHRLKTKAGSWKWIRDIGKISKEDENGKALRAVGVHIDIDSEKRAKEKIEYFSYHDSLTGLYNYRYLTEEIDRISDSRQYPISIVVGDLDRLKFINDNYGHEVGNDYIKKAADILENTFRNEDVVSRIGGDEFAVVLPNTGFKEAENIIERVKKQFRKVRNLDQRIKHLNISLGISTIENSSMDFKDAYKSADKNMYLDKKRKV
jgi:diguanylate cyclase (GGDEF)-like protein/PAS domain S-box-containing protein